MTIGSKYYYRPSFNVSSCDSRSTFRLSFVIGRPDITASLVTLASLGDDVTLKCNVDGYPTPKLGFTRDANAVDQIANSTKYQVDIQSKRRVRLV